MKFWKGNKQSVLGWILACAIVLTSMPGLQVKAAENSPKPVVTEPVTYEVFAANDFTYDESNTVTGTSEAANWDANLVASENVSMQKAAGWLGTNGYTASQHDTRSALYSTNEGGYAIFKVPMAESATITTLVINSRFCAGTAASFAISNALDGEYTHVYTVEEANSGKDIPVDIASYAADWTEVYVKATFPQTGCADWGALWNIRAEGTVEKAGVIVNNPIAYEVFAANDFTYDESNTVTGTSQAANWDANLVASDNVSMQNAAGWLGTNGYTASQHDTRSALYSTNEGGYAIFEVPMEEYVTITTLVINSRYCAGTAASFAVSNGLDGEYTHVYTVEEANSGKDVSVDIALLAADWNEIYVKVTFPQTGCADWGALWNIRAEGTKATVVEAVTVTTAVDVFAANDFTYDESNTVTGTSQAANWDANLVASENVSMQTAAGWLGTNGYTASQHDTRSALYSTNEGGYAIFEVPMDGATITTLVINSRYYAGTAASFAISDTVDGEFTHVYTVEEANSGKDIPVDIASIVAGWTDIYVKVTFPQTGCADGGALWNIRAEGTKLIAKPDDSEEEEVEPNPTDQTDSLVLTWEIGSEDKFGLASDGLTRSTVTAEAGTISESYNVAALASGKSMSFVLPEELGTETNLAIEIREIHMHGDKDITYTVALNGNDIQERTMTPESEGATHVWVDIIKNSLNTEGDNVITITNTGEQEIRFESIWLYENLDALLVEEDVYEPMEFVIFTIRVGYKDYEADLALVNEYKQNYSGYEKYTVGMAFDIFYMNWEQKTLYERIDWLMQLSYDSGMPLYLDLNSWWSGTSGGMDGQGGFWKDISNQQIIFDPDNVNGQGIWQLTTPNMWSNTPWLSLNNEWYNAVRNEKLEAVSEYISMKQAEYAARGKAIDVNIFMENEPIYWAYKHYNSTTKDGRADLSYLVIQAAAKDGLTLDPTDGLTKEEQLWLFKNLANYMEAEGEAVVSGLGNDAIIIVDGEVTYPTTQMTEKSFSHIPTRNTNESTTIDGVYYPFWEWHVVDSLRLGLEYATVSEMNSTSLSYVVARGKWADVNIERSAIANFNVLNSMYENGAEYGILFNVSKNDYPLVEATDSVLADIQESVQKRTRNLWISTRADVERLLDDIDANGDYAKAVEAYENGRYKTAYELLMKVQTTASLPIDFAISGTSQLLDYPVIVETADGSAVNVTLYEADDELVLKLTADTAETVKVTWKNVNTYSVEELGDGYYRLTKSGDKSGAAELVCDTYYEKDYPDEMEAVYISTSNGNINITSQDGSVSEYVNSVAIKLADDCVITREADGDESTRKTVEISALKKYDALYLTLNENDEVTSIKAVYGETIGRVVSITYPVVNGLEGLENPYITIKEADGTIREFEICAITGFDYPTMTGNNMQASKLTDYGLNAGDKIRISYMPYDMGDGHISAIRLYKIDYTTNVLKVTFEDGTLGDTHIEASNVHVCRLDNNYTNKVVTSTNKDELGYLIWQVQQTDNMPIGDMTIEFACRSIMGTALNIYMSEDNGATWTKIGQNELDGTWQSIQTLVVDDIEANTILVKVEMNSVGTGDPDTWASLDQISISIPSADMVAAEAVDELILAIGTVTKDSKDAIEAARKAYDALTDAQKEIVENDDVLADAEKAYAALVGEGDNDSEDGNDTEDGNGSEGGSSDDDIKDTGDATAVVIAMMLLLGAALLLVGFVSKKRFVR